MKLFEHYSSEIDSILRKSDFSEYSGVERKRSISSEILKGNESVKHFAAQQFNNQLIGDKVLLEFDKDGLKKLFGPNKSSFTDIVIGSHPDFSDVNYNSFCYHHCVSMFVDIKGSTRLGIKHPLETVRLIKDSLLTLCIHVSNFFGGHIHRLQGDAVFVQFARRNDVKNDALINALNSASILCQYAEKDLANIFTQNGLSPIKIRIGIDFGNDTKVLWSHYGIPGCSELTTTSLHTDLAAKLQARAKSNSIVIGGNVVNELDLPQEFYDWVYTIKDGQQVLDRYIVQEMAYNQHQFLWKKYLQSFDFINLASDGKTLDIDERDFKLICHTFTEGENNLHLYHQNLTSIPKYKKLRFTIYYKGQPYAKQSFERIVWTVENRGKEAQADKDLEHNIAGAYENKTECVVDSKYLGHHYMKCKIERDHMTNINLRFGVFIQ
ncbi:hypothetical protein FPZ43_17470 [Mucilaginibacter pallidiroseus]|uniref:Guanylate cyclase domain-containing protein n=1 Tax=Mucilaginibacter pallidiroseus TaxID=2599295 RepID=A0A563U2F6_9SPHI|nr:hypothetical protein [Mucilaginibacter pallidiroseus]TWR25259.1 hypothetical protein FPZ43_17470 [Mucilaginibacter pallidiroseus]